MDSIAHRSPAANHSAAQMKIKTGKNGYFAWTITLVVMTAVLEMGVLRPLENLLFRWKREAEST
jgi:hypothetical protein